MKVFNSIESISKSIDDIKSQNKRIGFVPTMGALHTGHLSLVSRALKENDYVVVSIFVNPTQFDKKEDLEKYPRSIKRDKDLLIALSKDRVIVFEPSVEDIYNNNVEALHFDFNGLESEMEGKFRPGHFDGVGTVVKRLLEIVKPENAYFGEKDYQQLQVVKKLVERHRLTVNVIGGKIHREKSGLAMSSRNERLKDEYKKVAPVIYKALIKAKEKFRTQSAKKITDWVTNEFTNQKLLDLEYFIIADAQTLKPIKRKSRKKSYRAFIAVFADGIRLIDNIALN